MRLFLRKKTWALLGRSADRRGRMGEAYRAKDTGLGRTVQSWSLDGEVKILSRAEGDEHPLGLPS